MKKQTSLTEIAALEKELAEIAPRVRQGLHQAGGPSLRVDEAIRAEARRVAARRQSRSAWAWMHVRAPFAAAAALALLLGGAALHQRTGEEAEPRNLSAARPSAAQTVNAASDNAASFAGVLLEIQGLSEEGFVRDEETAVLSL